MKGTTFYPRTNKGVLGDKDNNNGNNFLSKKLCPPGNPWESLNPENRKNPWNSWNSRNSKNYKQQQQRKRCHQPRKIYV